MCDDKTTVERKKEADADLASLNRVSHRLAMVDTTDKLGRVLDKLLPRLLQRIGDNHQTQLQLSSKSTSAEIESLKAALSKIHAKLVEMLSHTMKRVRDDKKCPLPCQGILDLLLLKEDFKTNQMNDIGQTQLFPLFAAKSDVDPFTLNLSLAFLTLGLNRCDANQLEEMLPGLLVLNGFFSTLPADSLHSPSTKSQWHQISHLLFRSMEALMQAEEEALAKRPSTSFRPASNAPTVANKRLKKSDSDSASANTSASNSIAQAGVSSLSASPLKMPLDNLSLARWILANDEKTASACYDFFLDLFLYQTVTGNVPPPGLSQASQIRLKSGHSETARDWGAEMAPRSRLVQAKSRLLDWIAPSRRWGLFLGKAQREKINIEDKSAKKEDVATTKGTARTIALLIAAVGDPTQEVSQRALTYLKQHLESQREQKEAYGDPLIITYELLVLCVGASNAQLALSNLNANVTLSTLGVFRTNDNSSNAQAILSLKRRMVSESTFATMVQYVSRILDEVPQLGTSTTTSKENVTNLQEATVMQRLSIVGTLAVLACSKMLSQLRTSMGLSMLRGKQYVAAAQLLNSLVVRLSAMETKATIEEEDYENMISTLLAKSMAIACSCLSTIATNRTTGNPNFTISSSSGSEGNTAVRDSLYGVICVLSRTKLPSEKMSWLFALGEVPNDSTDDMTSSQEKGTFIVSIETASLLYNCILGEEETLRPRAVAALDALLASYCRLVPADPEHKEEAHASMLQSENPWGQGSDTGSHLVPQSKEVKATFPRAVLAKRLLPLLWNASQHSQPKQSRVAAARWSSDLLQRLDLSSASHVLCFLAGDIDVTAASIARDGLGLSSNLSKTSEETSSTTPADFAELVGILFAERQNSDGISWRPNFWEFAPKGKAVAVQYLLKCLLHDIYGGDDNPMHTFVSAITESIVHAASNGREYLGLLDECARALSICLSTSSFARSLVASNNSSLKDDEIMQLALTCASSKARRLLANAWGFLYKDTLLWENDSWAVNVERALNASLEIMTGTASVGHKHGAAFLGGTCIKVYREHPTLNASTSISSVASSVFATMGNEVISADDAVGNAFADGITIACTYDQEDSPLLEDSLVPGATNALVKLAEALRKYGNGDNIDVPRVFKLTKSAGYCLAATTAYAGTSCQLGSTGENLGSARLKCVDALFFMLDSAAYRKDEEVALATGEALAIYSDAFSPEDVTWETKQDNWPAVMDEEFARVLPPHQQVLYTLLRRARLERNPQKRNSIAAALFAVVAKAAKMVNLDIKHTHRCLVQELCTRLEEVQTCFIALLADPKSKHLSRESCCLGLAACRSLANLSTTENAGENMNVRLLRAFGQTTNYGGSAMQETQQQASERRRAEGNSQSQNSVNDSDMPDTEIGGASGIGEASLGAYREMAGAAMSLGRPDILYALLMLSVSNPAWHSDGRDYSPTAILGQQSFLGSRDSEEMRNALKGHLGKLIPRILRGCHSPNRETREQMQNLWKGLTGGGAEARSAISKHLLVTVDTLIDDTSSKLWRTRLGACGALAQVIVGRSWKELGGGAAVLFDDDVVSRTVTGSTTAGVRLLRLWRVAMRSLDDVRVNVREAGETLGRGVRGLTLRLVDSNALREESHTPNENSMHEKNASAAAATSLRWLIKHGLNQPCPEATGVCVSCLVRIVDVANPSILQPLVPDLLRSLLLSMSSLEPAAFSYLQVRAAGQDRGTGDSYDTLERLRLQVVQSGPLATAVTKCMDMMPYMDLSIQKAVVPELDSAIRLSAGLTTRTAAADCVSTLCTTCPDAFKNVGSGLTNPSVSLLRALYYASERERGQAARDKYAHACGNLAALCPGASVRSLALRASEKYNSSTGSNDDPAARKAAAITLRAIAVKASNQFSDGGNSDVWCRRVLPVAFLGMRDSETKVASLFADVWEEGGSAANLAGAADGFGSLLEEKLIMHLVKECMKALKDVSWSRRVTGSEALQQLAKKEILSPTPRRLNSGSRDAIMEASVRARRRAEASNVALIGLVTLIAETRLWSGKQRVIEACCAIASKWSSTLASVEDTSEVFGTQGKECSWAPLVLTTPDNTGDLFLRDGWFDENNDTKLREEVSQDAADQMDIDGHEPQNESKMDFTDDATDTEQTDTSKDVATANEKDTVEQNELIVTYNGLCRMLLVQAFPTKRNTLSVKEEEILPYRASVLKALTELLQSIDEAPHGSNQKKIAFPFVADRLAGVFNPSSEEHKDESPLIVSRAIDCFAACFWKGFGSGDAPNARDENVSELVKIFQKKAAQDQPWTVKASSLRACARLVIHCDKEQLRSHATVSVFVECVSGAIKDRKFWKVRLAGLELLGALVNQAGRAQDSGGQVVKQDAKHREMQLVLEALLPHKEEMVKLAKKTLGDSEARVTALASNILSSMSWWP